MSTTAAQESTIAINSRLVKEGFAAIETFADKATSYFLGRLFAEDPQLRALFPVTMDVERGRLFRDLTRVVWSLDDPDAFAAGLEQLGCDNLKYGIRPEHYETIGRALVATARRFAGDAWSPGIEAAWRETYRAATEIMVAAAARELEGRPPWWVGEVTAHHRPAPDIAVITVRPDQPLTYWPGQYVSVETGRWPGVWRRYSIANAPRDDGTFDLHVRAVPAGWVSGALVRHTRVGDHVKIGRPLGGMVADDSGRDVLCVAGGTGLAPIKAVVEQLLDDRQARQIHLFFGVRREGDLYDLAALRRLEMSNPGLRVAAVVSDDPSYPGLQGMLPEVVARDRSWTDHDVYVSGPDEMILATVNRLQEVGMPMSRIRHDTGDNPLAGAAVSTDRPGKPRALADAS